MKRVFLHIGTEKTGTTSLQRFFCANSRLLSRVGIWYPCDPRKPYCLGDAHFPLAAAFQDERPEFVPLQKYLASERMFGELCDDMARTREGTVLLSAEHFSSRCSKPPATQALKELLGQFQVLVIVYLRPQEELLLSAYSTALKSGLDLSFEEAVRQWVIPESPYFNYFAMLQPWWEAFGEEGVIVRRFQPHRLLGGSLFTDMLRVLGLEGDDPLRVPPRQDEAPSRSDAGNLRQGLLRRMLRSRLLMRSSRAEPRPPLNEFDDQSFQLPERLNESLSREGADFLKAVNQRFPGFSEDTRAGWEEGQAFRQAVLPVLAAGTPIESLLSLDQRDHVRRLYSESNAKVAARLDGSGTLFDLPEPEEREIAVQYEGLGNDQLMDLMIGLWRRLR